MSAEQAARQTIDELLAQTGWPVQHLKQADIHAARGVSIREFVLNEGYGFADYLLYGDGKAAGVIEANLKRAQALRQAALARAFCPRSTPVDCGTQKRGDVP